MKLKMCSKEHYYDGDIYAQCPECFPENSAVKHLAPTSKKKVRVVSDAVTIAEPISETEDRLFPDDAVTVAEPISEFEDSRLSPDDEATVADIPSDDDDVVTVAEPFSEFEDTRLSPDNDVTVADVSSDEEDEKTEFAREIESTRASVRVRTSDMEQDKTIGFFDVDNIQPVVGWVVCISGTHKGESFNLKEGQNFIGRSPEMDILLSREQSVSRGCHAKIVFDYDSNEFYLVAGDTKGVTYLNNQLTLTSEKLKKRDIIRVGKSSLMFIPFCDEDFSWENC